MQVPASIGQKIVVPTSGEIMYGRPSALAAISYIIISISPYFLIEALLYIINGGICYTADDSILYQYFFLNIQWRMTYVNLKSVYN